MVTNQDGGNRVPKQGQKTGQKRRTVLTVDTPYGECSERLTAFGGLLAADLIGVANIFEEHFARPKRALKLGHYRMTLGVLLLLFVGFQWLGHYVHVRTETMICRTLRVRCLPAVSAF